MVDEFVKFSGWAAAIFASVFAGWATLRKTKVDESGVVLQAWKEITDRLEKEIAEVRSELRSAITDADSQRQKLRDVEQACYDERVEFHKIIGGLNQQILQLHTSYLAQMTILADPTNPDHAKLLQRAGELIDQVRKATENYG